MADPWDQTKFDAALTRYLLDTKRSIPAALNKKAYYVARKSLWYTKKVPRGVIPSQLSKEISITDEASESGRIFDVFGRSRSATTRTNMVPMAAAIINARRGRKSLPGLQGRAMLQAVARLAAARNRSVAFLKSGWVPARDILKKTFSTTMKSLPPDEGTIGRAKGTARPATEGPQPTATIENAAIARHDKKDALAKFGGAALQRAFDEEAASMIQYLDGELAKDTATANRALA